MIEVYVFNEVMYLNEIIYLNEVRDYKIVLFLSNRCFVLSRFI